MSSSTAQALRQTGTQPQSIGRARCCGRRRRLRAPRGALQLTFSRPPQHRPVSRRLCRCQPWQGEFIVDLTTQVRKSRKDSKPFCFEIVTGGTTNYMHATTEESVSRAASCPRRARGVLAAAHMTVVCRDLPTGRDTPPPTPAVLRVQGA